jgi:hypothetical protein
VIVAEEPFVLSAPPLELGQAESIATEPSNVMVGPPEMRKEGQPPWPPGQVGLYGSRRTTL